MSNFAARRGLFFVLTSSTLTFVFASVPAFAAGDAAQGGRNYDDTCRHCHGAPQPGKPGAFSDYDSTANRLSVYASDASAITKAANEGYAIPEGNSNDDYPPGTKTYVPMGSFAGSFGKRLGTGTTPTTYAIDIAAYFASLFSVPSEPAISNVSATDGQASVSFTAPKSDLTITEYTVTANPGGLHASGTSSPITVSGLTNGTAYKFTVTATSNAGTGKPSSSSHAVTPVAAVIAAAPSAVVAAKPVVPVAPAMIASVVKTEAPKEPVKQTTLSAKETTATAPASRTQSSVPIVTVPLPVAAPIITVAPAVAVAPAAKKFEPAAKETTAVPVAPVNVTDKPVVAMPPVASPTVASAKVELPKPSVLAAPIVAKSAQTAPAPAVSAPKIQTPMMKFARAGSTDARVFFVPAADSTPTTTYTVSVFVDGKTTAITATGAKSPIKVSGLTNGTAYTFTVSAINGKSASVASETSNVVTPLGILGD